MIRAKEPRGSYRLASKDDQQMPVTTSALENRTPP